MKKVFDHSGLTTDEKSILKKKKVRLAEIPALAAGALQLLLETSADRAKEISALYEFQRIPSIGIQFAKDLVSIGYYSLDALKHKNGADIFDALEKHTGMRIDPCVEDQCRLVVHYANDRNSKLNWWDFTEERKTDRINKTK
ncbi:helix-hairpin-helix domain-containing protein [Chitinophagaceae bacterium MMS25-I14]